MYELLEILANMQVQARKLREIMLLSSGDMVPLREALYAIEAAIYVMERMAADAYRAA